MKIGGIFIRIPPPRLGGGLYRESYKGEGRPPFHSPAGLQVENEMKCRLVWLPGKLVLYTSNKSTLIIKHLLP